MDLRSCLNMFEAYHMDNLWRARPVHGQLASGREAGKAFLVRLGEDKNASLESSPRPGRVENTPLGIFGHVVSELKHLGRHPYLLWTFLFSKAKMAASLRR